jgi:hypothetical protein
MPVADDIILDLIATGRQATPAELATIIGHVSRVPFSTRLSRVPLKVRTGLAQLGIVLPAGKIRSIEWHLLERIYLDEQWPVGTTEVQFVADLHQAVLHAQVQVWTYRYYTRPYAGFLAPSHVQQVPQPERYIFVAYSAFWSTMTTGHQASSVTSVFRQGVTDIVQHR